MNVIDWLLDSDPAIRWQVMRDLTDAPPDEVAAERAKVATEGWGAQALAAQPPNGVWGGGAYFPEWISTTPTLQLLREFGLDPDSPQARHALELVRANAKWEHEGQNYFDGEVEPCINGQALAIGAYFGQDVRGIVDRLLTEQMEDGGWNCEQERGSTRGSFETTINVLEGFLEYEQSTGGDSDVAAARVRGQEYLLERRLLRRLSTGELAQPRWLYLEFPVELALPPAPCPRSHAEGRGRAGRADGRGHRDRRIQARRRGPMAARARLPRGAGRRPRRDRRRTEPMAHAPGDASASMGGGRRAEASLERRIGMTESADDRPCQPVPRARISRPSSAARGSAAGLPVPAIQARAARGLQVVSRSRNAHFASARRRTVASRVTRPRRAAWSPTSMASPSAGARSSRARHTRAFSASTASHGRAEPKTRPTRACGR